MVSIIVPIYNTEEAYLTRCVQSLVQQTYGDIEILLIDDGSKEETVGIELALAKQFSCVRLIRQNNCGVSEARNRGIREAKGDFVFFVDSDDYIESDMIEKMLSEIEKGYLVVSNIMHTGSEQSVLHMEKKEIPIVINDEFVKRYLVGDIGKAVAFSVCNKVFDLDVLRDNSIFFPVEVGVGEDMIFVLRYLFECSGIKCIDMGLYHYDIRETSAMNSIKKDYLQDYCNTLLELKKVCINGRGICETALSRVALEFLTIILTNQYVKDMSYREFGAYYKGFIKTVLYEYSQNCRFVKNIKRQILIIMLKIKSRLGLYVLIRLNG